MVRTWGQDSKTKSQGREFDCSLLLRVMRLGARMEPGGTACVKLALQKDGQLWQSLAGGHTDSHTSVLATGAREVFLPAPEVWVPAVDGGSCTQRRKGPRYGMTALGRL